MIYSTKEKKIENNYGTVPISPSMTDATTKRKMFSRKPAYAVGNLVPENKKPTFEESINALTLVRPSLDGLRGTNQTEKTEWNIKDRTSEVARPAIIRNEASAHSYREIFYSPKSDKNILQGFGKALQRQPSKNSSDFKPNNTQESFVRSGVGYSREKSQIIHISTESNELRKSWKVKTNSVQSFDTPAKGVTGSRLSSEKSLHQGSLLLECAYCLNHKKKADLLTEKCLKLEDQLAHKTQTLKDISNKCDVLLRDKGELCHKLQKAIEKLQGKDEEFFKVREQLTQRIQQYKKDVIRLTQNIKYNQIEKSMLLRFKSDYQQLTKDYQNLKTESEKYKYDAEQYKKQLIAQMNKQHGYPFAKRSQGAAEISNSHFSKKSSNSPIQSNIYYDYEDDALSLNFSEQSYDHI